MIATLDIPAGALPDAAKAPVAGWGSQLKLALVIPTLREAENICALLDHVRSVLDPVGVPYEILVVDDDPVSIKLLQAAFGDHYAILTASTGNEAIEVAISDCPDRGTEGSDHPG